LFLIAESCELVHRQNMFVW